MTEATSTGLDTKYDSAGRPMTDEQVAEAQAAAEDAGPSGMPTASAADAPFSEDVVPGGWSRAPTAEEVAYLNEKYPVPEGGTAQYPAPNSTPAPTPAP